MSDRPQYEHDATKDETRFAPQEGEQYGGRAGERDPHGRLNTPLSDLQQQAENDSLVNGDPSPAHLRGRDKSEDIREVEDSEADEALRRAQDESGEAVEPDR